MRVPFLWRRLRHGRFGERDLVALADRDAAEAVEEAHDHAALRRWLANAMAGRGATVGFLDARAMGDFMAADAAKWKRVADFAKISLG